MLVNYIKYIKATGEIRQWGECGEDNPIFDSEYSEDDLGVLVGEGTNETHYVQLPGLTIEKKTKRPSASHDWDYSTKQWVMNLDAAWESVRIERDRILRSSDWRVTKAAELGQPIDLAWAVYRQALRNITSQTDPLNIVWPTVPT